MVSLYHLFSVGQWQVCNCHISYQTVDLTVGLALAPQPCEPSTEVCACHFLRSLYGQVGPKHFGKMVQLLKASTALAISWTVLCLMLVSKAAAAKSYVITKP